jgi:hypothetical protein
MSPRHDDPGGRPERVISTRRRRTIPVGLQRSERRVGLRLRVTCQSQADVADRRQGNAHSVRAQAAG